MNPQAQKLNNIIQNFNPNFLKLLSKTGQQIFFPKLGILSQAKDAKGKKINATIGSAMEDNGTPMRLSEIDKSIDLAPHDIFPYTSSYGKEELRQKWRQMIYQKNPSLSSEISIPVVTNALTHGLTSLGYLFFNPQDEIILADKYWGNYRIMLETNFQTTFKTYQTYDKNKFNLQNLEKTLNNGPIGKKIILLNFPNNPSGYTPTNEEVIKIEEIIKNSALKGNNILIILDDAYFGLVYENGVYKESLFSKLMNLHPNILVAKVDGITKEDYAWGLRVGFITFGCQNGSQKLYQALENKVSGIIRATISNVSHLSQSLALKAFQSPTYQSEKKDKYQILKKRYNKIKEIFKNKKYTQYFKPLPYNSGYFMCIELNDQFNSEKIRQTLLNKYDTGIIAIKNMIRIAYSSVKEAYLSELIENIFKACQEHSSN